MEQVTVVVNFDLPLDQSRQVDCETYLHRIGRTGRFGKTGIVINMIDGHRSMQNLQTIKRHFGEFPCRIKSCAHFVAYSVVRCV